jgi:sigma-E factor negative regulatory protein RseC
MDEVGVVTKVEGVRAHVSVARKSACEHCTAGTCRLSDDGAEIEALNKAGATVGQRVRVNIREYTYVSGSLFYYGVPAMALLAGALVGLNVLSGWFPGLDPEGVAAAAGFASMGLSLVLVKLWSRRAERKSAYQPIVAEVIETHSNSERGKNPDG